MLPSVRTLTAAAIVAASSLSAGAALASSHREAPLIAQDQYADNTDLYAFISPENADELVLIANYVPLLLPASGPNYYSFADDVRYEVCLDNDGNAVADVCFVWRFETSVANPDTFLYNVGPISSIDDANRNVTQTYDLFRVDHHRGTRTRTTIATDVPVAPWNVGSRTFPSDNYEDVAAQAIHTDATGGITMFAGPRDEPFFVDLHVFDLLGVGGAPTTDGVNVMTLALSVPIDSISAGGVRPTATDEPTSVVGVYARSLRLRAEILRIDEPGATYAGGWTQISRLGWPLVNEVVIPLGDKDRFNRTDPVDDVANYGAYILFPEVRDLLVAVLGLPCAETPPGGRTDIVGLLSPNGTTPADLLRINIAEGQTHDDSGFPNGRRPIDDVVDVLLTAVCKGGVAVGDGVDGNDLAFLDTFPFLASPHSGNP
jgi:hypothetical protein